MPCISPMFISSLTLAIIDDEFFIDSITVDDTLIDESYIDIPFNYAFIV